MSFKDKPLKKINCDNKKILDLLNKLSSQLQKTKQ